MLPCGRFLYSTILLVSMQYPEIICGISLRNSKARPLSKGIVQNYIISSKYDFGNVSPLKGKRYTRSVFEKTSIEMLHINSDIQVRFAEVVAESRIANYNDEAMEATFNVFIPEQAFISNFTMIIDNEMYVAQVKSKEDAEKEYEEAKKQNKTAAKVASSSYNPPPSTPPGTELFTVQVNVRGGSYVTFTLTYLEELVRKLGSYNQWISIRPNQLVEDLQTTVEAFEPQTFKFLNIYQPGSKEKTTSDAVKVTGTDTDKKVEYKATLAMQETVSERKGINGDLRIEYDVIHEDKDAGLVLVEGKYFSHHISPSGLVALGKRVVFVIDKSGSMSGDKIQQTQEAMLTILNQLEPTNCFDIILFSDTITKWAKKGMMRATRENVAKAKDYIRQYLKASGGTNINEALVTAGNIFSKLDKTVANMIIFMTDGMPTVGEVKPEDIVSNVVNAVGRKAVVFSLGFGLHLNYDLLYKISYRTEGRVIVVKESENAGEVLQSFFQEVAVPELLDIDISYSDNVVEEKSLTLTHFPQYFRGSEIVVCGVLKPNAPAIWDVVVTGLSKNHIKMTKTIDSRQSPLRLPQYNKGFTERLWAYKSIKDFVMKIDQTDDPEEIQELKREAVSRAIEYNLVTKFTSMIITEKNKPVQHMDELADDYLIHRSYAASSDGTIRHTWSHALQVVTAVIFLCVRN